MALNIEIGVKRAVAAKLRERGLSEQSANAIADRNLKTALQIFNSRTVNGKTIHRVAVESAYDEAFEAVTAWAATLKF